MKLALLSEHCELRGVTQTQSVLQTQLHTPRTGPVADANAKVHFYSGKLFFFGTAYTVATFYKRGEL